MEDLRKLYLETLESIQETISQTEEYKEYIQALNSFKETMTKEDLIAFEQLMDMQLNFFDEECFSNFVKGYHNGLNSDVLE